MDCIVHGVGKSQTQLSGFHFHFLYFFFFFFFSVTAIFYLEDSRRVQDLKRREWRSAWGGGESE